MNRVEKYEAARPKEQRELEKKIRLYHMDVFPEEYDETYDSSLDAKERRRGVNPMSKEYQKEVNQRRAALGIEPYEMTKPTSTMGWVEEMLESGQEEELKRLAASHGSV